MKFILLVSLVLLCTTACKSRSSASAAKDINLTPLDGVQDPNFRADYCGKNSFSASNNVQACLGLIMFWPAVEILNKNGEKKVYRVETEERDGDNLQLTIALENEAPVPFVFEISNWQTMTPKSAVGLGMKVEFFSAAGNAVATETPTITPLDGPVDPNFRAEYCGLNAGDQRVGIKMCLGQLTIWPALQIIQNNGRKKVYLVSNETRQGDFLVLNVTEQEGKTTGEVLFKIGNWEEMIPLSAEGLGLEIKTFLKVN